MQTSRKYRVSSLAANSAVLSPVDATTDAGVADVASITVSSTGSPSGLFQVGREFVVTIQRM